VPEHKQKRDSYKQARRARRRAKRQSKILKRALVAQAKAADKAKIAKTNAKRAVLTKQKAKAKQAKAAKKSYARKLKMAKALNKIAKQKQKIAKAIFTKRAIQKAALKAQKAADKQSAADEAERRRIAAQQLKLMREKRGVEKLKAEVLRLEAKSNQLHEDYIALREGDKPITTKNVLEDGFGNGMPEDGYSRHVPVPDRQMQKALDNIVSSVMGEARDRGRELRQHIHDASFPLMDAVDKWRNKYQDLRIEMQDQKAAPPDWPEAVFEAEGHIGDPNV